MELNSTGVDRDHKQDWANVLSKRERAQVEALPEFTQGAIYTAIAHGKPLKVGPTQRAPPHQYQEFVTLATKKDLQSLSWKSS